MSAARLRVAETGEKRHVAAHRLVPRTKAFERPKRIVRRRRGPEGRLCGVADPLAQRLREAAGLLAVEGLERREAIGERAVDLPGEQRLETVGAGQDPSEAGLPRPKARGLK